MYHRILTSSAPLFNGASSEYFLPSTQITIPAAFEREFDLKALLRRSRIDKVVMLSSIIIEHASMALNISSLDPGTYPSLPVQRRSTSPDGVFAITEMNTRDYSARFPSQSVATSHRLRGGIKYQLWKHPICRQTQIITRRTDRVLTGHRVVK